MQTSIGAKLFEKVLHGIFPKQDNSELARFRRRIYYPILNAWSDYGCVICSDIRDEENDHAKMTMTGFTFWMIRAQSHCLYNATGIASYICKRRGHKVVDCSTAGPDSGNMDHCCARCDEYWSAPLY